MDYSIENFCKNRISTESIGEVSRVEGWSKATSLKTFVEAQKWTPIIGQCAKSLFR